MSSPSPLPLPVILASGSRYRAQLLARIKVSFLGVAPNIDESPRANESAASLAVRLADAKARAIARQFPGHWVLGADQVAALGGHLMGKPGGHEQAVEQLRQLSGRPAQFLTAVTLLKDDRVLKAFDVTTVRFRTLKDADIQRYLAAEPAFDCAGSFKSEGLGITLFDEIQSRDPTALIGLPLIAVSRLLREAGYNLP